MPIRIIISLFFFLSFYSGIEFLYRQNITSTVSEDVILSEQMLMYRSYLSKVNRSTNREVSDVELAIPITKDRRLRGFVEAGNVFTVCNGCSGISVYIKDSSFNSENIALYSSGSLKAMSDNKVMLPFPHRLEEGAIVLIN